MRANQITGITSDVKMDIIIVIIWLTINVMNFNHKCNKYRKSYECESLFTSLFMNVSLYSRNIAGV